MVLVREILQAAQNGLNPPEGASVATIITILAIWMVLSIPLSVLLGFTLRGDDETGAPELLGMDGENAVYRDAAGRLVRVALVDHEVA